MSYIRSCTKSLALVSLLGFIAACSDSDEQAATEMAMDSLVSAEWLNEHLNDPDLVVLDCTVLVQMGGEGGFSIMSGRASYEDGHIPTAGFADLMGDLSDSESPYQFAVPSPEVFANAMNALGVNDNSRVVLYDSSGSAWAARVWWMLRWIGFDRAALLDGGLAAWTSAGYPMSTEAAIRPAGTLTVALRPELIVDKDEVHAAIGDESVNIIDALSEPVYRGDVTMYARPGHITGASNVPMSSLLDDAGHFRPRNELDELLVGDRDTRSITYCGGGIAASANAFVMTRQGFTDVAVYTASLQEWASDESLPMEVAPDPDAEHE